jgi:hypothetical protein
MQKARQLDVGERRATPLISFAATVFWDDQPGVISPGRALSLVGMLERGWLFVLSGTGLLLRGTGPWRHQE